LLKTTQVLLHVLCWLASLTDLRLPFVLHVPWCRCCCMAGAACCVVRAPQREQVRWAARAASWGAGGSGWVCCVCACTSTASRPAQCGCLWVNMVPVASRPSNTCLGARLAVLANNRHGCFIYCSFGSSAIVGNALLVVTILQITRRGLCCRFQDACSSRQGKSDGLKPQAATGWRRLVCRRLAGWCSASDGVATVVARLLCKAQHLSKPSLVVRLACRACVVLWVLSGMYASSQDCGGLLVLSPCFGRLTRWLLLWAM